ncbi:nudix (nucleoside diphosphate linked moiety X)-type motif 6 [Perkinsus olseni]|uniref:Nudix (Nucleoside diphosphate linked moiety X)-type motif 6 n=1 Tax=Perkinsus olseni TaxID=32597 RepID=A0A7J6RIW0_PEROL|nr:nudix (nucleoside diphosphate linked moiety X)-type motif 6 [Perkinsus olseni]
MSSSAIVIGRPVARSCDDVETCDGRPVVVAGVACCPKTYKQIRYGVSFWIYLIVISIGCTSGVWIGLIRDTAGLPWRIPTLLLILVLIWFVLAFFVPIRLQRLPDGVVLVTPLVKYTAMLNDITDVMMVRSACGSEALEAAHRYPCRTFFGFPTDYPGYLLIASNKCLGNMIVSLDEMQLLYDDLRNVIDARGEMAGVKADNKPKSEAAPRIRWIRNAAVDEKTGLSYHTDHYGGVAVDRFPDNLMDASSCIDALSKLCSRCKKEGILTGAFWVRIEEERYHLLPLLLKEQPPSNGLPHFRFHHADPTYAEIVGWTNPNREDRVPHQASHTVGVGAIVLDQKNRVLLVQEATGPAASIKLWKLVTGLVEAGEEIEDAAVREVHEETGITATFERVLAVRHSHKGTAELGNRSDLFWVCTLRVDEDNDANKAVLNLPDGELPRSYLQASEIKEARFVPYKQLHEITGVPEGSVMWCIYKQAQRYIQTGEGGLKSVLVPSGNLGPQLTHIYY